MKTTILVLMILLFFVSPVSAEQITAPEVPQIGEKYMPDDTQTFWDGLWYVIRTALTELQPGFLDAAGICLSVIIASILIGIVHNLSEKANKLLHAAGAVVIGLLLLRSSRSMINLGTETIIVMADYGKLLLPVMTAALAAQGATATSAALYSQTALFSSILMSIISSLIVPILYIYLLLCISGSALDEDLLNKLKSFAKWIMSWSLKIVLYIFTGFLSITGVVSGSADAAAIKATKLAISGIVPVVGGIISDASETILVSAEVMKSAAGVYGVLAIVAVFIGPFLRIGIQYLMLKLTAAVCSIFGVKNTTSLVSDFSGAMGIVMGMLGAICLLLLVSTVCFMKGVS